MKYKSATFRSLTNLCNVLNDNDIAKDDILLLECNTTSDGKIMVFLVYIEWEEKDF